MESEEKMTLDEMWFIFLQYLPQLIFWLGVALLAFVIIGMMIAAYYYTNYKMNVTVFPLYGSGKDGVFSFGKPKKNRVKIGKGATRWQKLFPLFNKKEIEPFDSEYIYPGNNLYCFELNGEWIPARINMLQEDKIRAYINPVPHYIRNWQSIEHRKNAVEFAKHDFWSDNKFFIYMVLAVGMCCVLCGATVYFTYKYAAGGQQSMQNLATALENFKNAGNIPLS